jgi:hypothetical protein
MPLSICCAAQAEVVVGEIDAVVAAHGDVVRPAEAAAVGGARREHRAAAVGLEAHQAAVVVRAPDHAPL